MFIAWHLSWWNGPMPIDDTKWIEKLWNEETVLKREAVMKTIQYMLAV